MVWDAVNKGGADRCVSQSVNRAEVVNVVKQGAEQGQERRGGVSLCHGFAVSPFFCVVNRRLAAIAAQS